MKRQENLLTVREFFELTHLSDRSRAKFDRFGFIRPQITLKGMFYKPEDVGLFKAMETFLDGKNDLRTAYSKALAAMQALAA
jgi:hypothetical protein